MSNASKSFTSMQATRSHRRDVNGMVGQWSTFNQMRTFLREICVPLQPADPLKLTASAALQNGLMFQPHSEDELFQMSNWTGRPKVRKHGGMAQSVARYCYHIVPPNQSHHFIVQIFAKLHSNPIWQKKNRFCFDIADKTPLRVCHRSVLPHTDSQLCG